MIPTNDEFILLKRAIETLKTRLNKLESVTSTPRYSGHLLALQHLPVGKLLPIDPSDQKPFLRAARLSGIEITTLKTDRGQMVLLKLKTRSLHKCPKCGYRNSCHDH